MYLAMNEYAYHKIICSLHLDFSALFSLAKFCSHLAPLFASLILRRALVSSP